MEALRERVVALERQVAAFTEGAPWMDGIHERLLVLEDNVGEGDDLGGMLTDLVKLLVSDVAALRDDVVLMKRQLATQGVASGSETRGKVKIPEPKAFEECM